MDNSPFPNTPRPEDVQEVDGLSFSLKIVQQPIRARMCGFGDKDRRNVTPAPILQLVAKTSNGEIVPTSQLMDRNFVVTADLWDHEQKNECNLVKAPAHVDPAGVSIEQQPHHPSPLELSPDHQGLNSDQRLSPSSSSSLFTTDTNTSQSLRGEGSLRQEPTHLPTPVTKYGLLEGNHKKDSHDDPNDDSGSSGLDPRSGGRMSPCKLITRYEAGESIREAVNSLEIADFSRARTATSSSRINQQNLQTPDNPPASPAVLSVTSLSTPTSSSPISLGTQSSEQTLAEATSSRQTLRLGRQLNTTIAGRSLSSSRHVSVEGDMVSIDTDSGQVDEQESRTFFAGLAEDQAAEDFIIRAGEDKPRAPRFSSGRRGGSHHQQQPQQTSLAPALSVPQTAGMLRSPRDVGLVGETDVQGQFARNLVGGVAVYGQLASDLENKIQIWFAFSTISIRTEGFFKIRFCLAEIGVQGQPQRVSPILHSIFSDTVHVQSPKRFQGTCDNNPLATNLNRQGIRVPTRKDEKKIIYRSGHDDSTFSGGGG